MTSNIIMEKEVLLGKNANIDKIVKKGQAIKSGDYLMEFEESYSEKEANLLLAKIGDEFEEEIHSLGKTPIKSKYTGKIKDIKCYYTIPFEEFSPSLQKAIKAINSETKDKEKILKQYFPNGDHNLVLEPTDSVPSTDGKVKGREVGDGLLIKFYIEYEDRLGIGDKITYFTAIKGVIQQTIPEEESPFTDFRPDEKIEAIHPTISYLARMCGSIPLNLYGNKVMVELKRKIEDIYKK